MARTHVESLTPQSSQRSVSLHANSDSTAGSHPVKSRTNSRRLGPLAVIVMASILPGVYTPHKGFEQ